MLRLKIPEMEYYDEVKEEFVQTRAVTIQLEHSLVSLAKWESIWEKPFLNTTDKSSEESISYIRCMTITQNVPDSVYDFIARNRQSIEAISEYINKPMTATTINDHHKGRHHNARIMTAELLYYDMFALNIPMECQKWHLNRLLMLIRVCSIESQPKKKMSRRDTMAYNHALNQARKQKFKTKG